MAKHQFIKFIRSIRQRNYVCQASLTNNHLKIALHITWCAYTQRKSTRRKFCLPQTNIEKKINNRKQHNNTQREWEDSWNNTLILGKVWLTNLMIHISRINTIIIKKLRTGTKLHYLTTCLACVEFSGRKFWHFEKLKLKKK